MSELDDLRSEVARLRRAATRKISRIKTSTGAEVSGTEFDPRRASQAHATYTRRQLEAYQQTLAGFLSRSNQFVPAASREPLPRAEFHEYKRLERAYAESAGNVYERIKNVQLPSGETIQQRLAKMDVLHKQMHNPSVNAIFDPHDRSADEIASRRALQKLTRQLKRDSSPQMVRRKVRESREQYKAMMDTINMPEIHEATKRLSNDQWVALWNYGGLASLVSLAYEAAKKMLSPKEESWGHARIRHMMNDVMELIEWAERI